MARILMGLESMGTIGESGRIRLHLLRHGETELSRDDRFCGTIDAPLTPAGRRMAEAFAARWAAPVSGRRWRAVYASTRQRAIDTASPLAARLGMDVTIDPGLDEIDYGAWQGRSKDEIARSDPGRFRRWLAAPAIGAPGGESAFDVAQRALAVVDGIRRLQGGGDVLVVAHKTLLRVLICSLVGVDLSLYRERIPQPVAGHSVIDLEGDRRWLRLLADVSHLSPELQARAIAREPRSLIALLAPEPSGDLVGEQEPRRRQLQTRIGRSEPARA